ncbi:MAG: hydrolase, partial [Acidithiobacillales bacterium SM23_46]
LARDDFGIEVLDRWRSARRGEYPARWRVSVPRAKLVLDVSPVLADQELAVSVRYWEGAVDVRGARAGNPVTGNGYVELTGYAEAALHSAGGSRLR